MTDIRSDIRPEVLEKELNKKRYKIIITEFSNELVIRGKEWKIGVNPKTDSDEGYDYTPAIEKIVQRERTVFQQEIDTLDLGTVICAVNGIMR